MSYSKNTSVSHNANNRLLYLIRKSYVWVILIYLTVLSSFRYSILGDHLPPALIENSCFSIFLTTSSTSVCESFPSRHFIVGSWSNLFAILCNLLVLLSRDETILLTRCLILAICEVVSLSIAISFDTDVATDGLIARSIAACFV